MTPPADAPSVLVLPAIQAMISPRDEVLRFLPHRDRRLVGAWCFVDVYGPREMAQGEAAMTVPPHSHIGLQTVSWVVDGEVLHRDSLGTTAMVVPDHTAVMTAGRGIAHSENTPQPHSGRLHGAQLWVALPDQWRDVTAKFELGHAAQAQQIDGGSAKVFVGDLPGLAGADVTVYSPLVAAEVTCAGGPVVVPVPAAYELLVVVLAGAARIGAAQLDPLAAGYLEPGRDEIRLDADPGTLLLVLGGEPFGEDIVMWWNFVARTHEEIVQARQQWNSGDGRFGEVAHYPDDTRLPAPELPAVRLKARGATR